MSNCLAKDLTILLTNLNAFTADCRDDMHEPDHAGISATVVGNHLDNACGNRVSVSSMQDGDQEFVLRLRNEDGERLDVNLATLIALARLASPESINDVLGLTEPKPVVEDVCSNYVFVERDEFGDFVQATLFEHGLEEAKRFAVLNGMNLEFTEFNPFTSLPAAKKFFDALDLG